MLAPMRRRSRNAFTLVELLVVIAVVAVIAGVVITQFDSVSHDELLGTAQVVAADMAHARNLAVTNNSSYKITFRSEDDRYVLTHSGTNSALDVLPTSAFHSSSATTEHVTDLRSLPIGSGGVKLAIVESADAYDYSDPEQVLDIEFGPLGETTRVQPTTIWLSTGTGQDRKFLGVDVNPITGLTSIGKLQTTVPYSLQ